MNARLFRSIAQPLFAPEGAAGAAAAAGGDDAAAKAAADAAAATAAAAAGKTPEQLAADAAEAAKGGTDAAKAAADAKAAEDAAKAAAGAPAKYELAIPKDGLVDVADLARLEELAREHNLPNDTAQSMLETTNAMLVKQANSWSAELESDKTYGGEKLAETQQLATQVLDKFAPKGDTYGDGLRRMLKGGAGQNLYVAALLARVGRAMQEDGPISGAAAGGETKKKSIAEQLYPNSPEFKK